MLRHAAVADAAAYPVDDDRLGQRVAVAVVLRPGHALSAREVRRWLIDHLAHGKAPSTVRFVDSLPRTPSGKLLRRVLAQDETWG
ncbi:MAG: AMP-binding enzyme [Chloroflexota bacterium]